MSGKTNADKPRERVDGRLCGPRWPLYWRCPACKGINTTWSDWSDVVLQVSGVDCYDKCSHCGQPVAIGSVEVQR